MDPYQVLNLMPDADFAQIKAAYHAQVKRWHPDQYLGTAQFDFAQTRLCQINAAYEQLCKLHEHTHLCDSDAAFCEKAQDKAQLHWLDLAYHSVLNGRLQQAQLLLRRITQRNARWYYVHGLLLRRLGDLNSAIGDFETAQRMAPGHADYRNAWQSALRLRKKKKQIKVAAATVATAAAVTATVILLT